MNGKGDAAHGQCDRAEESEYPNLTHDFDPRVLLSPAEEEGEEPHQEDAVHYKGPYIVHVIAVYGAAGASPAAAEAHAEAAAEIAHVTDEGCNVHEEQEPKEHALLAPRLGMWDGFGHVLSVLSVLSVCVV